MGLGFEKFGISDSEIMDSIAADSEVDAALNEKMQDEMVPYARSQAPVDSGEYAAGIRVTKPARGGKGQIGATHWTSHFIEDGTKADAKGSKSRFGPDTPTPEFAVMQKTAAHFGGTLNRKEK